jgi:hypothetical protein
MLNLMMTTLVWILSIGLFQFSWIHHTFQQAFSSITPTLMESMVTLSYDEDQWLIGFDANLVHVTLIPYFDEHVQDFSQSYTFSFELYDQGLVCTTYCSTIEIDLIYLNGGKHWNMNRRFQVYGF